MLLFMSALALGQDATTTTGFYSGGGVTSSFTYLARTCISGMDVSSSASSIYSGEPGTPGDQPSIVGVLATGGSSSVDVGGTLQFGIEEVLDDSTVTTIPTAEVSWSVLNGPIVSVNANGVATAASGLDNVTSATIQGAYGGFTDRFTLTVITAGYNTWQAQYFGGTNPLGNPDADADGTGQSNLFKYTAGLNPTDSNSRFTVSIAPMPGQSGQAGITFSPVANGRTYTVQYCTDLTSPNWQALQGSTQVTSGSSTTVVDPNATGAKKFYRVQISMP